MKGSGADMPRHITTEHIDMANKKKAVRAMEAAESHLEDASDNLRNEIQKDVIDEITEETRKMRRALEDQVKSSDE